MSERYGVITYRLIVNYYVMYEWGRNLKKTAVGF